MSQHVYAVMNQFNDGIHDKLAFCIIGKHPMANNQILLVRKFN